MKHIIPFLAGLCIVMLVTTIVFLFLRFSEYIMFGLAIIAPIILSYSIGRQMYEEGSLDWIMNKFK